MIPVAPTLRSLRTDVVVIGGGQAGLAVAFFLKRLQRRTPFSFLVLDDQSAPGGAWRHGWESLRLFSPAEWSSLPGWLLPRAQAERYPDGDAPEYPTRDDVIAYLGAYEERYDLPVERPVRVEAVEVGENGRLAVITDHGEISARAVVSATGTWSEPFIPEIPGRADFQGESLHSSAYRSPVPFLGKRVLVVGGGNSGAQIAAELSSGSDVVWATLDEPQYLPEHVDGRVLFNQATARYAAVQAGEDPGPSYSLGQIVQVAPVREARAAGHLRDVRRPPVRFTRSGVVWPDGSEDAIDAVIWCTGFGPALRHLAPLGVVAADGRVRVEDAQSVQEPRLWLVGYGEWTGFASATLIGVGRSAKATAEAVVESLSVPG